MAPIHLACERGHNFVLKFLAEHGADTNLKSARDDATPLMLACKEGMTETVKMLISLGALLLLRNRSGHTALHYATQGDHLGCIQPICEAHTSLRKAWLIALANGGKVDDETGEMFRQYNRLSSVTKLLKKHSGSGVGVKAAQRPPSSASAQHEAEDTPAAKEVNDEADFLHSEKDLIEAPCNNRMQPLHMACHYNACNVVQYLLDCGADASALDAVGETPLHKAARGGYRTIYHLLVTAGADETVHSKLRDTPRQLLYDESSF
jgi:ankyrin repeat protein